jgi:PAS domain S-box-containing protein
MTTTGAASTEAHHSAKSPQFWALAALALGLFLSAITAYWKSADNERIVHDKFSGLINQTVQAIQDRMRLYSYGVHSTRGAVLGSGFESFGRQKLLNYTNSRSIAAEFPGARGFGVIRKITSGQEPGFVASMRAADWPEFKIRQLQPHAGERYVIQLIEPFATNAAAVGLDIASEINRKAAADLAVQTNAPAITAPITLVQAEGRSQTSFLLLLPIFQSGASLETAAERIQATQGWAYAPLVIEDALASANLHRSDLSVRLRDADDTQAAYFYSQSTDQPLVSDHQEIVQVPVFGRVWQAEFRPTLAYVAGLNLLSPSAVFLVGGLLSFLLAVLVYVWRKLATRTSEIAQERARRATMVYYSADAILAEGLDGTVLDWNPAATRLFGFSYEQVINQPLAKFFLPASRAHEDQAVIRAVSNDPRPQIFDSTRLNSDGELVHVAITAAPILDSQGRVVGVVKTVRDVGEIKRAEAEIRQLNAKLEQQVQDRTAQLDHTQHDLQNILNAVPSMIGYWDKELKNRVANQAYEKWFGLTPQQIKGMHIRDLLGEDIYQLNSPYIEKTLAGIPQSFERTIPAPDGRGARHSMIHYLPDLVDGEVQGFYTLVHDITELEDGRQKLAALQRDNEALLKTMFTHTIVSVADGSGRIVDVNDTFCNTFGYSKEELLGHRHHEKLESDQQGPEFWALLWESISGGNTWRGDICIRTKAGDFCWINSIVEPFFGPDGAIEKFISISFDISAARRAALALRESQKFLERASSLAKLGAWQLDIESAQLTWSPQLKKIYEVDYDFQPLQDSGYDRYLPEYRPILDAAVQRCISDGTPWDLELRLTTAKGKTIWARVVGEATFEEGRAVQLIGILQDIDAQKEAELLLARERYLMTSLLNSLPDQIYFKDSDSRFMRINPGLAKRFGLGDPSEAVGKTDADFYTQEHFLATSALEKSIMESGTPVLNLEEQETWLDKAPTWNLSTKMPLLDANGLVIGMFGISRDITSRKQVEAELQISNARFEMAADGGNIGVWDFDLEHNTLVWDERVYRLFGVEVENAPDPITIWEQCLHPEDWESYEEATRGALLHGQPLDYEFRIIRPDGELRYLKSAARTTLNALGKPSHLTGVNFDVTDQRRAAIKLQESTALLENVLQAASEVAIIATDENLLIRVFNAGAEHLLGYSSVEMVGLQTPILIHDEDEVVSRAQEMAMQLGGPVEGGAVFTHPSVLRQPREWTYVHKTGERIAVSLVVTAMHDNAGNLFGYLGMATDITRQKQVEQSLVQAVDTAKQASLAKSQFLANMSHEIRTPMNAVIGLTYLMGHTALNPEQEAFLEKIRLASESLLILINDVLDLSKIEAKELTLEKAPVNLRRLLRDLLAVMELAAQTKGLRLDAHIPVDLPEVVLGDSTRLRQILTNLLSNAIKFTAEGSVTLGIEIKSSESGKHRIRFSVTDTGIGIKDSAQSKLFEPFAQEDSSTTRKFGGTGLGLSIVKHLVVLMGGELGLVSKLGEGSKFWFALELEEATAQETSKLQTTHAVAAVSGLKDIRVLVVDDNAINLEVAKRILQMQGAVVSLASDGRQAVDMLTQNPKGYDAVLMDIQMPEMDGLAATRHIRQQLGLTDLPIIALSAGAMLEEQQEAKNAGMNDFVSKPFEVKRLVTCIRGLLAEFPATAPSTAPAPLGPSTSGTPWPEIDGVSTDDAMSRLGGDLDMFISMLSLLFREHLKELTSTDIENSDQDLQDLKRRMHKLKGAAGTLGLNEVYALAAEAESSCLAADKAAAMSTAKHVSAALLRVQASATPHLTQHAEAKKVATPPPSTPLGLQDLEELRDLLQRQSFDALEKFDTLQAQIRPRLTADAFDEVQTCMEGLDFAKALNLLSNLAA